MGFFKGLVASCLCAVPVVSQPLPPPEGGDHSTTVIVMYGQSNTAGQCFRRPPVELRAPPANVQLCDWVDGLTVRGWGPVEPRTDLNGRRGWGPYMQLAHDLSQRGGNWHMIVVGKNSSTQYNNWNPFAGDLYPVLVSYVAMRTSELEAVGWVVTRTVVVQIQGESDSTNPERASAYCTNLRACISGLRAAFNASLFVIVKGYPIAPQFDMMDTVRGAMEQVCIENSDVVTVSAEGCQVRPLPDGRHYTSAGLVELGHRLANAIP